MKFKFGPYCTWFGVYQFAEMFRPIITEEQSDKLGEYLSDTWFDKFLTWIHSKKKQKVVVKIDKWDLWSMDYMLAQIIYPLMVQLKARKQGVSYVDDNDVPEHLRTGISFYEENFSDTEKKWQYVMDEIIWAFERLSKDDIDDLSYIDGKYDHKLSMELNDRVRGGTTLFGRYLTSMWD
jgi:hypothetical protein